MGWLHYFKLVLLCHYNSLLSSMTQSFWLFTPVWILDEYLIMNNIDFPLNRWKTSLCLSQMAGYSVTWFTTITLKSCKSRPLATAPHRLWTVPLWAVLSWTAPTATRTAPSTSTHPSTKVWFCSILSNDNKLLGFQGSKRIISYIVLQYRPGISLVWIQRSPWKGEEQLQTGQQCGCVPWGSSGHDQPHRHVQHHSKWKGLMQLLKINYWAVKRLGLVVEPDR